MWRPSQEPDRPLVHQFPVECTAPIVDGCQISSRNLRIQNVYINSSSQKEASGAETASDLVPIITLTHWELLNVKDYNFICFQNKIANLTQNFVERLLPRNPMIHPEPRLQGPIVSYSNIEIPNAMHQLPGDVITLNFYSTFGECLF